VRQVSTGIVEFGRKVRQNQSALVLIMANLVPLGGVIFAHWSALRTSARRNLSITTDQSMGVSQCGRFMITKGRAHAGDKKLEEALKMAKDVAVGYRVGATVTEVKGTCNAGHQVGDTFEISCHNPGGLCGFFYHNIFPTLSTFQFGGSFPWWQGDTIQVQCPDLRNLVTLKLERSKRK